VLASGNGGGDRLIHFVCEGSGQFSHRCRPADPREIRLCLTQRVFGAIAGLLNASFYLHQSGDEQSCDQEDRISQVDSGSTGWRSVLHRKKCSKAKAESPTDKSPGPKPPKRLLTRPREGNMTPGRRWAKPPPVRCCRKSLPDCNLEVWRALSSPTGSWAADGFLISHRRASDPPNDCATFPMRSRWAGAGVQRPLSTPQSCAWRRAARPRAERTTTRRAGLSGKWIRRARHRSRVTAPKGTLRSRHSVASPWAEQSFTVPGVALGRAAPGSGARSCQQRRTLSCQTGASRRAHLDVIGAGPQIHGLQFSELCRRKRHRCIPRRF